MADSGLSFGAALSIEAKLIAESWRDWSGTLFGKPRRFHEVAYTLEAGGCTKYREGQRKILIWKGIGRVDD